MMDMKKSSLSRRTMLGAITIGGASAGAAALAALNRSVGMVMSPQEDSWWRRGGVALESAGSREWTDRIGRAFEIGSAGDGGNYKLVDVQALISEGERPEDVTRQQAFLAVFESADGKAIGDRIYPVKHSTGALDVYFSPADPEWPNRLQAVFN